MSAILALFCVIIEGVWYVPKWIFFSPQNDSELFGRTIRVNLAKPMKIKEGHAKPGKLSFGI